MGTVVLKRSDLFAIGSTAGIYPPDAVLPAQGPLQAPVLPAIATAPVDAAGTLTFSDPHLEVGVRYLVYELVAGQHVYCAAFAQSDPVPISTGGNVPEVTADTFEPYRIIMLSNGTVRAIPAGALPPDVPSGLARTVRLTSVTLTWLAAARAQSYAVMRNGVQIATTFALKYRDTTVVLSGNYSYTVASIDPYGQRSAPSSPVTAFIDPAINVAPTIAIRAWPTTFPSNGKTLIRVCAADADAQSLTLALAKTAGTGTLTPTDDPSIWTYAP